MKFSSDEFFKKYERWMFLVEKWEKFRSTRKIVVEFDFELKPESEVILN